MTTPRTYDDGDKASSASHVASKDDHLEVAHVPAKTAAGNTTAKHLSMWHVKRNGQRETHGIRMASNGVALFWDRVDGRG